MPRKSMFAPIIDPDPLPATGFRPLLPDVSALTYVIDRLRDLSEADRERVIKSVVAYFSVKTSDY